MPLPFRDSSDDRVSLSADRDLPGVIGGRVVNNYYLDVEARLEDTTDYFCNCLNFVAYRYDYCDPNDFDYRVV